MTVKRLIIAASLGTLLIAAPAHAVTMEEVITLTKLGITPGEVIKAIEKDRTVFNLSVTDILALKKASVADQVLKFMLATPQKYGGGGAPGSPGIVTPSRELDPAETTPVPPVEETPEERASREERERQEAMKLLEEQRAAQAAQRQAFAKGVLAKGRSLGDRGRFVEAIQAFQKFMDQGGFPPDSQEAYFAKFGIANALVQAGGDDATGLHQAAARQLVDVLLAGPERPFFQTAFQQLRELRRKVNYAPPALEQLTKFFVGSFSAAFQDEYNYVLGEFFYDYANWSKALSYLDQVSSAAPDYAKAQYLKGLVEVRNQMYRSAVGSFQNAIVATDENKSDPEIRDLGYLALARIAYDSEQHDAAIYYYRKIPKGSYKRATAFYESAWVYFVKGDFSRALGTFQTLHSPYFEHRFYPELWILEATIYMNTCRFSDAEESLSRYMTDIDPLVAPLTDFLLKTARPEQFYRALVETVGGKSVHGLPRELVAPVLADVQFYNLYRTVKQIEREIALLSPHVSTLGEFAENMKRELENLRQNRIREIGIKIQRVLKEVETTLAEYDLKVKEIEVDLQDEMLKEEERKLLSLEEDEEKVVSAQVETGGASAIVGGDSWQWPYEGEYWSDEIGTYRAFFSDRCAQAVDPMAPLPEDGGPATSDDVPTDDGGAGLF
jgi:tetratricopeptide (TPR) repeat protein